MKKALTLYVLLLSTLVSYSDEILSSMESNFFDMNLHSGDITVESVTEISPIEFDASWVEDDTNIVGRLVVNGDAVKEFAGYGQLDWIPSTSGVYNVSCEFLRDGIKIGEALCASFSISPVSISFTPDNPIVASLPQSVTIICSDPSAIIHYTMDGSEPNSNSTTYVDAIDLNSNAIIKAVGIVRRGFSSAIGSQQYVYSVPTPRITPSDGSTFALNTCEVEISVDLPNAIVYYTTNGNSPRLTDTYRYKGPFTIDKSSTVRAIAVFQTLKSGYVNATITKVDPTAPGSPVITPGDGYHFRNGFCEVSIAAPTAGSKIYYSMDGTTPSQDAALQYVSPFIVSNTVSIKAIAVHDGIVSECTEATLTKVVLDIQEAIGSDEISISTEGDAPWSPVWDDSLTGTDVTVRSGTMETSKGDDGNRSLLKIRVNGEGTLSFYWKVDCEHDDSGDCTWDRLMYFVDGSSTAKDKIDGTTEWMKVEIPLSGLTTHTVDIVYFKDADQDPSFDGEDCAWIGMVSWQGAAVDPIPDIGSNPTTQQIESALLGSADTKLSENITDGTTYGQYRDWASKVKAKGGSSAVGADAVKNAPNAWLSFALGSETLIETAPTDGDLKVDNFEPATESGKFDFTVSVTDIEVGSEATAENLKKVFGLEGGTTLEPGGLSSDNVNITFGTPENGKVKFTAGPKNTSEGTFFMKVKMTP